MKITILVFLILIQNFSNAQMKRPSVADLILNEKIRIDTFDGKLDSFVAVNNDEETSRIATLVYLKMADSLVKRIERSEILYNWQKQNLTYGVYKTLSEVSQNTYSLPLYFQKLFHNAFGIVGAIEHGDLLSFLITDPLYSIKNVYFYKNFQDAKTFLVHSSLTFPNEVLKVFYKYREMKYRDTVVEVCGVVAPNVTKNYLIGETEIRLILRENTNPSIMGMRGFFNEYNILSKGMVLVDDIIEGKMTISEAHTISQDPRKFLRKMIEIRNEPYCQAIYSLDEELKISALKYAREINNLHNEPNPKIRFKSVDDFNWKELYTLLVYSEDEIFTSSFNGVFERLLYRLKEDKVTGWQMLERMQFNKFRTFIKLCAGYGKLNNFLQTMSKDKSNELLTKFTNNLEKNSGDLRPAIDVADAFGSIKSKEQLELIQKNIINEYQRVEKDNVKNGLAIYGLLKSLFASKSDNDSLWFKEVASKYKLNPVDKISIQDLKGYDKVHRQIHFFYDDDDGYASFSSFLATFNTPNYKITNRSTYVKIESIKGSKIEIYANQPKAELDGQAALIAKFDSFRKDIQMMVHRGHSYYTMNTIDQMPSTTKIVFLGSCGSYNNINEVLNRSSNCHIISSKQIGTMSVNNPLLFIIAEVVRSNKDLDWNYIWFELYEKVKNNKYAFEKFQDYVPPHKNLGAIFIQAYTKFVTEL
jgi:hypothetical protein